MAQFPTLTPDKDSIDEVRGGALFLKVRVQAEPLAAGLIPPIDAFMGRVKSVRDHAEAIDDAIVGAEAGIVAKDVTLDFLVNKVSAGTHEGGRVDPTHPTHQLFFGNATPSEFRKPVLAGELAAMVPWPGLLAAASSKDLQALAAPVAEAVSAGQAAEAALQTAQTDKRKFELDGALGELFNGYNALAAEVYAGLTKIATANGYSAAWVSSFFQHDSTSYDTVAEATKRVASAEKALSKAQAKLAEAQTAASNKAKRKSDKLAANATAAAAKQVADEAAKKAKEAEAAAKKLR